MPSATGGQDSSAATGGQASSASAQYVLTLSCPDRTGIVHAVAAYLHEAGCNVLDSQQFGDRTAGRFFMRVHVETVPGAPLTYDSTRPGGLLTPAGFFSRSARHAPALAISLMAFC